MVANLAVARERRAFPTALCRGAFVKKSGSYLYTFLHVHVQLGMQYINLKYSRETSTYLVKIGMQSICSSYLSTTSVSSRLWAKNAGSAACPLGPAHGLYSECAALSSASLLSLSYHLLWSLILACAGTDARLCAGGELLALLLALHFHRRMELSVLHFLPTINDLPPHI